MLISRVINVFSLAVTLCAFQDAARAFEEPRNQPEPAEPQEPINIRPTVDNIYWMVFEPDDDTTLTVDQVKDLIIEAIALLRSPANQYEASTPEDAPALVHLFYLFHEVVEEHGTNYCDNDKLVRIKVLETSFGNHHNLGPFLKHFNSRRFEVCSRQLIEKMSFIHRVLEEFARQEYRSTERFHHLNKLSELVARRRNELIEAGEYPIGDDNEEQDSSLRNSSVSIMQYLADDLEIDIHKPVDRPMADQLTLISQILDDLFFDECDDLGSMHGQDFVRYQLHVHHYRLELRPLFWENELVANLLDKLTICHQLTYSNSHVYLLGHYNIGELMSRIEGPEEVPPPEEIADLIDIMIFALQAELYLGHDHEALAKYYIELLVPSQISSQKCLAGYFRLLKRKVDWAADKPNLIGYFRHYNRLQVLECLQQFEATLENLTHEIELEQVIELASLSNIFRDVAQQVEPSLLLYYDTIPYTVTRLSAGKIFHTLGFNLFTLQEPDLARLPATEDKIRNLFDTCRLIIDKLAPTVAMFRLFIQLDPDVTSRMNSEKLDLMSQYNICKALVDLSDDRVTLQFGNLTI